MVTLLLGIWKESSSPMEYKEANNLCNKDCERWRWNII